MTVLRQFALAGFCAALFVMAPASPQAQTNVCRDLEARLVSLQSGDRSQTRRNFREYDRSVQQQQGEIKRASAEARRVGCVAGLFLAPRSRAPKCDRLMATIGRMKVNLRRLITERNRFTNSPQTLARHRNEILRAMSVNRCSTGQARIRAAPRNSGGILGALFGNSRTRSFGEDVFFSGRGSTHRTVCVRTCDGYYFPISFSTVASQFQRDQQICSTMCPGTDVRLYTYRNPGEEADAMRSLAGQPYTALPTAFKYRNEYDPACGCQAVSDVNLAAAFDTTSAVQRFVAVPPRRRPRFEDPETLANRKGWYTIKVRRSETGKVVADLPEAAGIRLVGPSFYIGGETEIGALIPARRPSLREAGEETVN
ncbi:MAG: DUF2865 domain-containing protein [Alphaproteobacteria bacterium]